MKNNISPIRKKYDIATITLLGIILLGAIPMGFCDKLEGFFLVYFIVYLALVIISLVVLGICFPIVRKGEIKFFKNKYSIENMEKSIIKDIQIQDISFYTTNGQKIKFTENKIEDISNKKEYLYSQFKIYATYQCSYAGEIYAVYINFKNENVFYSVCLNNILYSYIKLYKIKVEFLNDVLNNCESNLKEFFKSKELQKQAKERKISEDLNELVEPILELYKEKATCSNFTLFIKYHDNFNIKYDYTTQKMYINNKYFYSVEERDLLPFLTEINNDLYYIIEYKNRRLNRFPYFKLLNKNKTDINKIKKDKNVLKVFDINHVII